MNSTKMTDRLDAGVLADSLRERATSRAKTGGRDDQVDDPGRHHDSDPIADFEKVNGGVP
jgi:hypothetical protein